MALSFDRAQTKPRVPYLARQMSEEISSRVAECTRLNPTEGLGLEGTYERWIDAQEDARI